MTAKIRDEGPRWLAGVVFALLGFAAFGLLIVFVHVLLSR
jgi:hypothetical protein